jgi:hypothetical protein
MKKGILAGLICLFFIGCAPQTLYNWGNYQEQTYSYAKDATDKSLEALMKTYQTLINHPTGTRKTVPPGICADYGYLLYQQGKTEEGLALLNKEIALYPESSVFISRIIKNLQK